RQASETFGGKGISVYLSRGYNSAACAALAAQLDPAATALCLDRTRSGAPDDGTAIAAALGLKSVLLRRAEREKSSDGKDRISRAEFPGVYEFSVGLGLADECLKAPAELVAGRIVLTGFHGDRMWGPVAEPRRTLTRTDTTGASLGEFRLRAGFLHIPVPMLGFWAAPRLQEILRSDAMEKWRLGGDYDRPIARRIAEEAGVPREMFGHRKETAATLVASYRKLTPPLLKMLVARYRPATNLLKGIAWRLRAGLARRFGRKAAAGRVPGQKPATPAGTAPDPAPPRTVL
ncbi:MAG TPA: hypothetical protein VN240_09410, partial [Propylenella sp.]|nr:hypothetical protein [Propylenella sp.]